MFITECAECGLPSSPIERIKTGAIEDIVILMCVQQHKDQVMQSEADLMSRSYKASLQN